VLNSEAEHTQAAEVTSATSNGAVTITNASPPVRGRRIKFTPQVIEQIKESVEAGISRDEIANRVGVTVGSLQVTCSRLGISLRRITLPNGLECHMPDIRGRTIATPCSVGIAHVREQKEMSQPATCAAPSANFAIVMRHRGKEQTTDVPLPSPAIEVLALETMLRDLAIARLIGQILVAAINKDMIHKILR
jgi:DNA-binding transcriptional regulator YiaG